MRAVVFDAFGAPPVLREVDDPAPPADGVVVQVRATGVCRSDWHGWMGHDPSIRLPHVPGHEFAGVVRAVGSEVRTVRQGARVTAPFVCGCGRCATCRAGDPQVCPDQTQPGFTHWGSFAEFVVVRAADANVVELPDDLDFMPAASLGCRFATAFRAVVDQGQVRPGQWVAVHGCGGVGLSAVMIAAASGANVIAVDVAPSALRMARALGAVHTIDATGVEDVAAEVVGRSAGGAHLSLDALGDPTTWANSISGLRRRGRHVQVGLLLGAHRSPAIPMDRVVAFELEVLGTHGIQAHRYEAIWEMIRTGRLDMQQLVGRSISLEQSMVALTEMHASAAAGVTVVTSF